AGRDPASARLCGSEPPGGIRGHRRNAYSTCRSVAMSEERGRGLRYASDRDRRDRRAARADLRPAGWRPGPFLAVAAGLRVGAPVSRRAARADGPPSLERDVAPILKAHCLKCHGPNKPKGKLNLASPRAMVRGGASGPAIVPGKPDESELWDQVSSG